MPLAASQSAQLSLPLARVAGDWLPLSDLYAAFDAATANARRVAAQRWAAALPAAQRRGGGRGAPLHVHVAAYLPGHVSVDSWRRAQQPDAAPLSPLRIHLPAGHESWSAADHQRYADTRTLLAAWRQFLCDSGRRADEQAAALFARLPLGEFAPGGISPGVLVDDWARAANLRVNARRLRSYAERLPRDGNVDARGRRGGDVEFSNQIITPDGQVVDEAWEFFRAAYLVPGRSVALCYALLRDEARRRGWSIPSLRSVHRRVGADPQLAPFLSDYARLGPRRWERHHMPTLQRDYAAWHPMQLWVGDHHQLDVFARRGDKVDRPWLTAWMDLRSRVIVGWVLGWSPNSDTILAAFRSAVEQHGAPLEIVIDNGKDYRAVGFAGGRAPAAAGMPLPSVCQTLDIRVHPTLPFRPQSKPIESFFGTFAGSFSRLQPTWCGHRPDARPESIDLAAAPDLAALAAQLAGWLVGYHERPHSGDGMDGRSPATVLAGPDCLPRRTAPRDVLDVLLSRVVRAKVTRHGVRYQGVYYGQASPDIWALSGREVLLRVDERDAAALLLCALDGTPLRDSFGAQLVARNERLGGATAEDVRATILRQRAARRMAKAACAVRDAAREQVDRAIARQLAQRPVAALGTGTDGAPRPLQLLPAAHAFAAPAQPLRSACAAPSAGDLRDDLDELPLDLSVVESLEDDAEQLPVDDLDAAADAAEDWLLDA